MLICFSPVKWFLFIHCEFGFGLFAIDDGDDDDHAAKQLAIAWCNIWLWLKWHDFGIGAQKKNRKKSLKFHYIYNAKYFRNISFPWDYFSLILEFGDFESIGRKNTQFIRRVIAIVLFSYL